MFLRINRNLTSFDRLRVLAAQELLAPLLARALFLGCTVDLLCTTPLKNYMTPCPKKLTGTLWMAGVRVVFCTIAFGMDINVEGAYIALHFGPSSCLDDYLQEIGRIGRSSDRQSHTVLLTYSGCTRSKNITNGMKEYVRNADVCRRSMLMQPFLDCQDKPDEETRMERHSCCDVCAKMCRCVCLCKGKCTYDNVCSSELFFSP